MIDAEEVVRLREERERIDAVRDKRATNREKMKEVAAAAASGTASSSKGAQKKGTGVLGKLPKPCKAIGKKMREVLEDDSIQGVKLRRRTLL